ncbi:hypothetical protein [Ramlibacter pallidus]|uniref:DUF3108 domain-containing protein n=1 Tax=Ramlibacter pallidus TaxID=2780087 RepID=A0ABR9S7W6_9BURK|nr:hypothetical protein [Ramlibacter pallidus]MBE7369092.1 hypothetical protein [Ramlibacter pallidus]
MDNPVYHVVLEGRTIGPYDRRTIVGMRIKKTLTSDHVLVGADGGKLTVAELVHGSPTQPAFEPSRGDGAASYSVVQATCPATLVEVEGKGYAIPPFKGELEVRVQTKVLRIAGRYREGRAWKEDRVKFPLEDIAHARLRGSIVDLWVRTSKAGEGLQRLTLDMFSPEAAGELTEKLTHSAPWPGSEPLAGRAAAGSTMLHPLLWAAVVGSAVLVGTILVWTLTRRF